MSISNSFSTAVSGMSAQSEALNHISDNVANSQTIGFRRVDTRFESLVTQYGGGRSSGIVTAQADATNDVQGTIEQVESPLALALDGRGFFSVARPAGRAADGTQIFDGRAIYSRAGDFARNRDGYLVNGSGDVLQGWLANASGEVDTTRLQPVRADKPLMPPEPTSRVTLAANLPAGATAGTSATTVGQVYDTLGRMHDLQLGWTRAEADNTWTLTVSQPDTGASSSYQVQFATNGAPAGTIGEIRDATGTRIGGYEAGNPGRASLSFSAAFGGAEQPITLDLGDYGGTVGVTQFAGRAYDLRSLDHDGAPQGAFSSVAVQADGRVVANYDNGRSVTLAQVPVVTFAEADALERLDGQAFAWTAEAGAARVAAAGSGGAAQIEVGAIERSNVDISTEFSRMIVAQRAYSANTRVFSTADELLQDTLNLKR